MRKVPAIRDGAFTATSNVSSCHQHPPFLSSRCTFHIPGCLPGDLTVSLCQVSRQQEQKVSRRWSCTQENREFFNLWPIIGDSNLPSNGLLLKLFLGLEGAFVICTETMAIKSPADQHSLVVAEGIFAQLFSATYRGHTTFTSLFVCDVPTAWVGHGVFPAVFPASMETFFSNLEKKHNLIMIITWLRLMIFPQLSKQSVSH